MEAYDSAKSDWRGERLVSIGLVLFALVSLTSAFAILVGGLYDQQFTTGGIEETKRVWTGNVSSLLKANGNWQTLEAPLFGSDLEFNEAARRKSVYNDFTDAQIFRALNISGSDFSFEGAQYALAGGISANQSFAFNAPVTLKANQKFDLGSTNIVSADFAALNLEQVNLEVAVENNEEVNFNATVLGTGNLRKTGTGKLNLAGQYNQVGNFEISAGRVEFSGIGERLSVHLSESGQLNLIGGSALESITTDDAAQLNLTSAAVNNPLSSLETDLNLTPVSRFNLSFLKDLQIPRLKVGGAIDLGNANFVLTNTLDPALASGTEIIVIENANSQNISGKFKDLPEGSTPIAGLNTFKLSYQGGDGNDLTLTVIPNETSAVFRFFKQSSGKHFYTISATEKSQLIATDPSWAYEGVGFHAFLKTDCAGKDSIYRFFSPGRQVHFYTINTAEKDNLIENDPNWNFEGVGFCAENADTSSTKPLFRFWNPTTQSHFFTANSSERDTLLQNPNWRYEGVAFFVR